MPIQIRCTCQQILAVDEAHQGQIVVCPYCGIQLTVPVVSQAPAGYAPPPPPPGFPAQHPGAIPQGFTPPNVPSQPATPTGWQPTLQQSPSLPTANNPFGNAPAAVESNPFAAPQLPQFPGAGGPAFPGPAPAPVGPVSNAPSMPFLAMDVPAKGEGTINDLTRGTPNVPGGWDESAPEEPRLWHIPCPNGHILETPEEMLDQDVLCPYCEKQFTLRKFQSVEETQKREKIREIRDEKTGQFWLNFAIGVAAVVILGVIIMIAIAASSK